jgi:hypothetical protein
MKKYCTVIVKKWMCRFWRIYKFSAPLITKKWFLEYRLSVYIEMCVPLVPEQLLGDVILSRYLRVHESQVVAW